MWSATSLASAGVVLLSFLGWHRSDGVDDFQVPSNAFWQAELEPVHTDAETMSHTTVQMLMMLASVLLHLILSCIYRRRNHDALPNASGEATAAKALLEVSCQTDPPASIARVSPCESEHSDGLETDAITAPAPHRPVVHTGPITLWASAPASSDDDSVQSEKPTTRVRVQLRSVPIRPGLAPGTPLSRALPVPSEPASAPASARPSKTDMAPVSAPTRRLMGRASSFPKRAAQVVRKLSFTRNSGKFKKRGPDKADALAPSVDGGAIGQIYTNDALQLLPPLPYWSSSPTYEAPTVSPSSEEALA